MQIQNSLALSYFGYFVEGFSWKKEECTSKNTGKDDDGGSMVILLVVIWEVVIRKNFGGIVVIAAGVLVWRKFSRVADYEATRGVTHLKY